jgi:hypothetical protein
MILTNTVHPTDLAAEWLSNILILVILVFLYGIYRLFFHQKKEGFLKFIRYFLLPYTFLSGFVVYFIGYQAGNSHNDPYAVLTNILESVFSTARLFILGNDLVEVEAPFKHDPIFHAMFALTAFLAGFIFISFMAHVFLKDWLIKRKLQKMKVEENHFFLGINRSTLSLANDLLKTRKSRLVVFINDLFENENQQLYSELPEDAYMIRCKSFLESISLEKEEGLLHYLGGGKNHDHQKKHKNSLIHHVKLMERKTGIVETHFYLLTEDEDWNIEQAKIILNELNNHPYKKPVRIHVAIYSEIAEKYFDYYTRLKSDCISVIIHHYATLVSRQLINDHHPVNSIEFDADAATATTDFNALIIGFGQVGTNVLRKLIEQGQFVGSVFHATMIDKSMDVLRGRFEHLYPGIIENYDLHFVEAEAGHSQFYKEIKKVIDEINYLVISLGSDNLNIQTALEMLEINSIKKRKSLKIFIQLEEESHWRETLKKYKDCIFIFGEANKVFSENNILQSQVEKQGRIVHAGYCRLYGDDRPFDEITRHEQLSNISVANHLFAKVKILGYSSLAEFSTNFRDNNEYLNSLSEVQKLNLSIGEHLRWNAFHFTHGWTTLPIEQITGINGERYKNRKNTELKLQSCLISWEKLEELSAFLGKDMQKGDTDLIEHLYDFINYNPQKL